MTTKGIRGAITVDNNTETDLKEATLLLLTELMKKNNLEKNQISHVIFTLTNDLNAAFPAKFARLDLGFDNIAMLCFNEIDVPNAIQKCLRIMIVVNCDNDFEPDFVYLKGAKNLR